MSGAFPPLWRTLQRCRCNYRGSSYVEVPLRFAMLKGSTRITRAYALLAIAHCNEYMTATLFRLYASYSILLIHTDTRLDIRCHQGSNAHAKAAPMPMSIPAISTAQRRCCSTPQHFGTCVDGFASTWHPVKVCGCIPQRWPR